MRENGFATLHIPLLPGLVVAVAFVFVQPSSVMAQHERLSPRDSQRDSQRPVSSFADERVVVNSELVTLNVTVMDPQGHLTEGLTKSAFTVYENDSPQEISFFSDDDAPASVAIVFDTSGSMTEEKILCAREALASFISTSHGKDEFFLISFSSTAQPLLDKTRDSDALLDKLTYVQPSGNTALYDAVYLGLEKLAGAVYQKRALLIISDGQDNHSRYTAGEVRQRLAESGVLTYSVGVSTSYLRPTSQEIVGVDVLKRLARVSGGRAYFPSNAEEMSEAFERISIELRRQYSIGYRPSNVPVNGEWRRVKVAVATPASNGKRLVVRSREGYYAPVDRH